MTVSSLFGCLFPLSPLLFLSLCYQLEKVKVNVAKPNITPCLPTCSLLQCESVTSIDEVYFCILLNLNCLCLCFDKQHMVKVILCQTQICLFMGWQLQPSFYFSEHSLLVSYPLEASGCTVRNTSHIQVLQSITQDESHPAPSINCQPCQSAGLGIQHCYAFPSLESQQASACNYMRDSRKNGSAESSQLKQL